MVTVQEVVAKLEQLWPASTAESWDNPGLVVGNPNEKVTGIHLSVDLTDEVVSEAIALGANLIVTHHPFILGGVNTIAESEAKGALLARMVRANIASFAAHTNADIADNGVSAAFARALGLTDLSPITSDGHGRIGSLSQPVSLDHLVEKILAVAPATARGLSASASESVTVQRVAVCGGSGGSFIAQAHAAGADVYVTADLKHHVAQDSPLPLIDISHWASESLWLPELKAALAPTFATAISISEINTDPWVFRRNIAGLN